MAGGAGGDEDEDEDEDEDSSGGPTAAAAGTPGLLQNVQQRVADVQQAVADASQVNRLCCSGACDSCAHGVVSTCCVERVE